jgi:hypothetical protein
LLLVLLLMLWHLDRLLWHLLLGQVLLLLPWGLQVLLLWLLLLLLL